MHTEEVGGAGPLRRKSDPVAPGRPRGIVIERTMLRERPLRGAIGVRDRKGGLGWAQAVEDNPIGRKAGKARGRECKDGKKPERKTSQRAAPRSGFIGRETRKSVTPEAGLSDCFSARILLSIGLGVLESGGSEKSSMARSLESQLLTSGQVTH